MGYYINSYSSKGLYLIGEKDVSAFISQAVPIIKEEALKGYYPSAEIIENAAAAVISETDLPKKVEAFRHFTEDVLSYPFDIGFEKETLDPEHPGPIMTVEYDIAEKGDKWHETPVEAMVKALAPFMKAGSYLGFAGEDEDMWSYVFDGDGSFKQAYPTIDWTGGLYPAGH